MNQADLEELQANHLFSFWKTTLLTFLIQEDWENNKVIQKGVTLLFAYE